MSKKKILVVDDNRDLVRLFIVRLEQEGYEVYAAFEAAQAMMQINKVAPDLVLLDIMLPAGGGVSVLQNVRMKASTSKLPVIIITGQSDEGIKKVAEKWGISGFFFKPLDAAVLIQKIKQSLGERKRYK